MGIDGTGRRVLRPRDENGVPCHQVVTDGGIYYEANLHEDGERRVYAGRYDPHAHAHQEVRLPGVAYVHTGFDPAGKMLCYEDQGSHHLLFTLHHPLDPDRFEMKPLREMPPNCWGQRYHAHPFLGPLRRGLYFTEMVGRYSQVCALEVEDLADLEEYWGEWTRPRRPGTGALRAGERASVEVALTWGRVESLNVKDLPDSLPGTVDSLQ